MLLIDYPRYLNDCHWSLHIRSATTSGVLQARTARRADR